MFACRQALSERLCSVGGPVRFSKQAPCHVERCRRQSHSSTSCAGPDATQELSRFCSVRSPVRFSKQADCHVGTAHNTRSQAQRRAQDPTLHKQRLRLRSVGKLACHVGMHTTAQAQRRERDPTLYGNIHSFPSCPSCPSWWAIATTQVTPRSVACAALFASQNRRSATLGQPQRKITSTTL